MPADSDFRLLFIHVGVKTHNPAIPTLISAFQDLSNPNVHSIDLLTTSLSELQSELKWSSLALIERTLFQNVENSAGMKFFIQYTSTPVENHLRSGVSIILDSDAELGLLAGNYDLHAPLLENFNGTQLSRFSILVWPYVVRPIAREEVRSAYRDDWMGIGLDPLANWKAITAEIPRQIEYTHMLNANEIKSVPKIQLFDACVPGSGYATRKIALSSLKSQNLSSAPFTSTDRWLRGMTKIFSRGLLTETTIKTRFYLRQKNMNFLIRSSKSAYVCGSGYEYFVRKFLEVPALGVPLVAYPVPALERLGFEEGLHYRAAFPEEYSNVAQDLLASHSATAKLIFESIQLMRTYHCSASRVKDLVAALSLVSSEESKGAQFTRGRLKPA